MMQAPIFASQSTSWGLSKSFSDRQARWIQLAILAATLCLGILIAAQTYKTIDQDLTEAALSRRASVSYLAAATLSEKFDRLVDIGIALATRVRFRELVAIGKWEEAVQILAAAPADFPFIDRLFLSSADGTLMADTPSLTGVRGKTFAHRDWYQGVSKSWTPYVSRIYKRAAEPRAHVIAIAVPIKDKLNETVGILVIEVKLEHFFEWLTKINIGHESHLYVIDQHGAMAFHPKLSPEGELVDLSRVPVVQKVLKGEKGVETSMDSTTGIENVVAYEPIPKYGWGVIAQQPASAAFATRNAQLQRVLIADGLILIFCILVISMGMQTILHRRRVAEDRFIKFELERQVAERTTQLEQSNKDLESFCYSVSHDLRTPLRAIDGFSRVLEDECRDALNDEGRRRISTIRRNVQKMGQLIDDLLAFSRMGREVILAREIDMTQLAQEVFEELQTTSISNVNARFIINPMPTAWGDSALLRQVWINLLSNAAKFASGQNDATVEVGCHAGNDENVYYVKDNGAGFDMRYYDKLFGVFQRLHTIDQFPGTGVGLAIVQRIVTRHNGRVWATGVVGEGATFYFALPRKPAAQSLA